MRPRPRPRKTGGVSVPARCVCRRFNEAAAAAAENAARVGSRLVEIEVLQ